MAEREYDREREGRCERERSKERERKDPDAPLKERQQFERDPFCPHTASHGRPPIPPPIPAHISGVLLLKCEHALF